MRRSALFIDFDNFFSGLLGADPAAAIAAVENPGTWLRGLEQGPAGEALRRWLVLRCYLNPAGSVADPRDPGRRLYFSTFRPFFTQAGVEVVDCPSLTKSAKNGADIRIVVDVMTTLQTATGFDELVIASSDADFTPLLQVVRAHDRRIAIIATSTTARAYEALAHEVLDEAAVFGLAAGRAEDGPRSTTGFGTVDGDEAVAPIAADAPRLDEARSAPLAAAPPDGTEDEPLNDPRARFEELVRAQYQDADAALNLATLSTGLVAELGPVATGTHWFGSGGFVAALRRLSLPGAQFSQHHVWDERRHETPPIAPRSTPDLPATVSRVAAVSSLPRIPSSSWPVVYGTLEAYCVTHDFDFSEATKWARDQAVAEGVEISRQAFSYAVRACRNAGTPLTDQPGPDAETIGRALLASVLQQCELAGLDLADDERAELSGWLHVVGSPED
ncbi:NYN domain-containing protein [Phycicoccus duodecadis]|uniref:NYN domain-containing protein n=1 Tax=Phycicoccus duodecadis TaxID=173053 RepID=A0A2N3YL90_9MICO|nr:NYN domain-containing protein [Phycicoccus duodecadis]PKW27558.1 NYN domain-containing protein [Phycicoccus duodecadis]